MSIVEAIKHWSHLLGRKISNRLLINDQWLICLITSEDLKQKLSKYRIVKMNYPVFVLKTNKDLFN